jgi:hypothetical protein
MKMQAGLRNDRDGRVIVGSAFSFLEMYWRSITGRFFDQGCNKKGANRRKQTPRLSMVPKAGIGYVTGGHSN